MSNLRNYLAMVLIVATLGESLGGCVLTYRNFPEEALHQHELKKEDEKLYYKVQKFPILDAGGFNALKSAFRTNRMFSETISVEEPPEKGIYTLVEVTYEPLSLPSLIFGYISVSTLTLIPAYSGNDGYLVKYTVYANHNQIKTYEYQITRKVALWAPLLAFSWVNLGTYSEAEAFTATANQFFTDAQRDGLFAKKE